MSQIVPLIGLFTRGQQMRDENQIDGGSVHTGECHEEIAGQEQLYLDTIEENLRAILIFEEEEARLTDETNMFCILDSDEKKCAQPGADPPLSDETAARIMRWFGAI